MLDVLHLVIVEDILPDHQKHLLLEILTEMEEAKPALRADARFQGLYQLATR